jgi:CelD/BcsL family acetyltransferase involved in cellulose biosynthesis
VATGIFPGANGIVHFWGGGSWREHQHLRPNEAVHWAAIEDSKGRGFERYDLMGGGQYKERYGAYPIVTAQGRASRFGLLEHLRNSRRALHGLVQRASGKLLR